MLRHHRLSVCWVRQRPQGGGLQRRGWGPSQSGHGEVPGGPHGRRDRDPGVGASGVGVGVGAGPSPLPEWPRGGAWGPQGR